MKYRWIKHTSRLSRIVFRYCCRRLRAIILAGRVKAWPLFRERFFPLDIASLARFPHIFNIGRLPAAKQKPGAASAQLFQDIWRLLKGKQQFSFLAYLNSLLMAITAGYAAWLLKTIPDTTYANLAIIFLIAVMVSTAKYGMGPGIFTAIGGIFIYDQFFIRDLPWQFSVTSAHGIITVVTFFIAAVITAYLADKMRQQTRRVEKREAHIRALYQLTNEIAKANGLDHLLRLAVPALNAMLSAEVVVLLPDPRRNRLVRKYPSRYDLDQTLWAIAQQTYENTKTSAFHAQRNTIFVPLITALGKVGVMVIRHHKHWQYDSHYRNLLDALSNQLAIAIEREQLADSMQEAILVSERESLHSAILASISHDLKTPLTSIIGNCSALLDVPGISADAWKGMVGSIYNEAQRLHQFINNLLETARFESGDLLPNRDNADIREVIYSVVQRMEKRLANHTLRYQFSSTLPSVFVDFTLMQQVIQNILDNAVKYSSAGSTIIISTRKRGESEIAVTFTDEGRGISQKDMEHIFDKFYRSRFRDRKVAGTGLGLSIAKNIIEAHGGTITARNNPHKGANFIIALPISRKDQQQSKAKIAA